MPKQPQTNTRALKQAMMQELLTGRTRLVDMRLIYRCFVGIYRCCRGIVWIGGIWTSENGAGETENKKPMDIGFTGVKTLNTRHDSEFCPLVRIG